MSHITPEELDKSLRRVKRYIDENGTYISSEPDEDITAMINEVFGFSSSSNGSGGSNGQE